MSTRSFDEAVDAILAKDARYTKGAYRLVQEALTFTTQRAKKLSAQGKTQHVRGGVLLEGFRDFVLEQYGPMSFYLLTSWGIKTGEDVGNIVFNLIGENIFSRTEDDSIEDFKETLDDFDVAFLKPFRPQRAITNTQPTSRRSRKTRPPTSFEKSPDIL